MMIINLSLTIFRKIFLIQSLYLFSILRDNFTHKTENSSNKYWCDIGFNKTRECTYVDDLRFRRIIDNFYMFNVDQTKAESDDFINDVFSLWTPLCKKDGKKIFFS